MKQMKHVVLFAWACLAFQTVDAVTAFFDTLQPQQLVTAKLVRHERQWDVFYLPAPPANCCPTCLCLPPPPPADAKSCELLSDLLNR